MVSVTLRLRRYLLPAVLFTISGVLAGAFAAKISQYHPNDCPTKYTAQALKMSEGRAQQVHPVVLTAVAANLAPQLLLSDGPILPETPRPSSGEPAEPARLRAPPVSFLS